MAINILKRTRTLSDDVYSEWSEWETTSDAAPYVNTDLIEYKLDNAVEFKPKYEANFASILGQPIAAIVPTAKALEVQGYIDAKTSKAIQAAGALASFGMGMISGMQALDAINTAKSYGAINDIEAALMAGATIAGMISGVKGLQNQMNSLGFSATTSDLRDFGITSDGNGNSYISGTLITTSNLQRYMISFALYMARKNKADRLRSDIYERMAGSLFYNNLAAGGDMFNPMISPITNHIGAISKDVNYPLYAQMSLLQNDFIETVVNPFNIVLAYS